MCVLNVITVFFKVKMQYLLTCKLHTVQLYFALAQERSSIFKTSADVKCKMARRDKIFFFLSFQLVVVGMIDKVKLWD